MTPYDPNGKTGRRVSDVTDRVTWDRLIDEFEGVKDEFEGVEG